MRRSKVRAMARKHRSTIRETARAGLLTWKNGTPVDPSACDEVAANWREFHNEITVDVHAAREHARDLVVLKAEQERFEVWTREQGLGPECGQLFGEDFVGHESWPGRMPGRWAALGGDRRAPMGRSLARLGQRILDMLEGQPSECQTCTEGTQQLVVRPKVYDLQPEAIAENLAWHRRAWSSVEVEDRRTDAGVLFSQTLTCSRRCPDCQGTGNNLHGVLPPLEWSPAVRRKARDTVEALRRHRAARASQLLGRRRAYAWPELLTDAYEAGRESGWTLTRVDPDTGEIVRDAKMRTAPRGEHREQVPARCNGLDATITARGLVPRYGLEKLPRWRRGELEHARQRREREAWSRIELLEAPSLETSRGSDRFPATHRARFRAIGADAYRYFRDCMDERRAVDLRRLGLTGLPEGEWIVGGFQTRADTMITEVIIMRLVPMGMREQRQHGDLADD